MIGIFDSGVGGQTVAREIKKRNPKASIIYFGDTARVPWGNKSLQIIREYSKEICDFLISKGAKEIVIACNTASAFAGDYLKKEYSLVKIHDVITPVVERILEDGLPKDSKILVIGTRGTVSSGVYANKIREAGLEVEVFSKACPLFVQIVEDGLEKSQIADDATEEYLKEFKNIGLSKIILACTHYPLLKDVIVKYFDGKVECIGSDEEIAKRISFDETEDNGKNDSFYFSDLSEGYLELAKNIYGSEIVAEKINLQNEK